MQMMHERHKYNDVDSNSVLFVPDINKEAQCVFASNITDATGRSSISLTAKDTDSNELLIFHDG